MNTFRTPFFFLLTSDFGNVGKQYKNGEMEDRSRFVPVIILSKFFTLPAEGNCNNIFRFFSILKNRKERKVVLSFLATLQADIALCIIRSCCSYTCMCRSQNSKIGRDSQCNYHFREWLDSRTFSKHSDTSGERRFFCGENRSCFSCQKRKKIKIKNFAATWSNKNKSTRHTGHKVQCMTSAML